MKLKIYSNDDMFPSLSKRFLIYPFLNGRPENLLYQYEYDKYKNVGSSLFRLTDLEDADLAVMPFEWHTIMQDQNSLKGAIEFAKEVKKKDKELVIFFHGHLSHSEVPIKDAFIFRNSIYKSKKRTKDFSVPTWSVDFIENDYNNILLKREKKETPSIGFCGLVRPLGLMTKLKENLIRSKVWSINNCFKKFPSEHGHVLRKRIIEILKKSKITKHKFILRDMWAGGTFCNPKIANKVRREYLQNIRHSDYVLCVKGDANYSYRLFETLCCGRIPVFVNTDSVLPYESFIDWKKYCVWIEEKDIKIIDKKIVEFHENLSEKEFIKLQSKCRKLWEEWLSPMGFFKNFHKHFDI